jgi:UDP-N-acetylmuramoyl-tripeptide--D-alanyl-D-alanine ligase
VSIDTRTLQAGQLYVAIPGERYDGHEFVEQAFVRGAAAACVASGKTGVMPAGRALLVVDDTKKALAAMAGGYRRTLAMETVAVTGSVGKTTVKEMLADMLATGGPTARTRGNWNNDIGLPLSLLATERDARHGVFELGMNHPGELAPLCRLLRPRTGVVTTVGPVHMEFFRSVEEIAREKASILEELPADGLAVLSRDETFFGLLRSHAPCRVVTTSLGGPADFTATRMDGPGHRFVVRGPDGGEGSFTIGIPGDFIVRDALYAIAVGRSRGLSWETLSETLRNFQPPGMRWRRETFHGVTFINDAYNANPVSMRAALQAFAGEEARGGKWLVLAGMRELGGREQAEHEELGEAVAQGSWEGLICVGPLARGIADGAARAGMPAARIFHCADQAQAAALLTARVRPGDFVLLKASRGEQVETVLEGWKKRQEKEEANHASG